ncbi:MAG TPA: divalent metal cation transporter [Terriglobales bacterium]
MNLSVLIAGFIIVACAATSFLHGQYTVSNAGEAAQSLRPLGGDYEFTLFAIGLLNASLFAASILPLSTAYTVCEAMGFESGLNKKFRDAKVFYGLYTGLIAVGALLILSPKINPVKLLSSRRCSMEFFCP